MQFFGVIWIGNNLINAIFIVKESISPVYDFRDTVQPNTDDLDKNVQQIIVGDKDDVPSIKGKVLLSN